MIWVALIFIGGLLLGLPLAFVMGMTGVAHLITLGNEAFVNVIPQRLFMGINNITLSCLSDIRPAARLRGDGQDRQGPPARQQAGQR